MMLGQLPFFSVKRVEDLLVAHFKDFPTRNGCLICSNSSFFISYLRFFQRCKISLAISRRFVINILIHHECPFPKVVNNSSHKKIFWKITLMFLYLVFLFHKTILQTIKTVLYLSAFWKSWYPILMTVYSTNGDSLRQDSQQSSVNQQVPESCF